jgi:hypothetical protein
MDNQTAVQKFLRSELSFYITLIGAVLTIAGFYFGISNKIDLMAQRLDTHIEMTSEFPKQIAQLEKEVAVLKVNLNK